MSAVFYGVAGEGFGHSSRAHLIGQWLLEAGHEVIFLASNKSFRYLNRVFPGRVIKTCGPSFVYSENRVSLSRTFFHNLRQFPEFLNSAFSRELRSFRPELVISDFEPVSALWAKLNRIPCISIDHEHLLSNAFYQDPEISGFVRYLSRKVTEKYLAEPDTYIILNFFRAEVRNSKTLIAPPVVRTQLLNLEPSAQDHIICYATSETILDSFMKTLPRIRDQKFFIYGTNEDRTVKNCIFKSASTEGFLKDLSTCRGIIATGGFSLISECLHLRKKMLLIPIQNQYEQMINAVNMKRLSLGQYSANINSKYCLMKYFYLITMQYLI